MGRIKYCRVLLLLMISACNRNPKIVPLPAPKQDYSQEIISVNKEIVRREQADIKLLSKRYNWDLVQTESGLCYQILNPNQLPKAQKGDIVQLKGNISTADGNIIYNTRRDGIKEMRVLGSEDIVGLHELVQLMSEGEQARAIIPSFLAYGISGDGMDVAALSSVICEIEIIKIVKQNS